MTHYSRICKLVIDAPLTDYDREVSFWEGAIGETIQPVPGAEEYGGAVLRSPRMWFFVQRLDCGEAGRVHFDIHTDDLEAEVARLERLGGTRERKVHSWWVMRDPAGLLFCVIPHPSGDLNDSNAQRWD